MFEEKSAADDKAGTIGAIREVLAILVLTGKVGGRWDNNLRACTIVLQPA